ncbi:MAG TPA: hypothetical protein VI819_02660 [Patescibacteria group bacterium]|nr:hypothetical protein [Patescibacteria group bacterium]
MGVETNNTQTIRIAPDITWVVGPAPEEAKPKHSVEVKPIRNLYSDHERFNINLQYPNTGVNLEQFYTTNQKTKRLNNQTVDALTQNFERFEATLPQNLTYLQKQTAVKEFITYQEELNPDDKDFLRIMKRSFSARVVWQKRRGGFSEHQPNFVSKKWKEIDTEKSPLLLITNTETEIPNGDERIVTTIDAAANGWPIDGSLPQKESHSQSFIYQLRFVEKEDVEKWLGKMKARVKDKLITIMSANNLSPEQFRDYFDPLVVFLSDRVSRMSQREVLRIIQTDDIEEIYTISKPRSSIINEKFSASSSENEFDSKANASKNFREDVYRFVRRERIINSYLDKTNNKYK